MTADPTQTEGLRDRKKRETLQRIAETALKLFIEKGYEGTTLDEIAAESGIARRTFFYYFKSKEAILMAFIDNGYVKSLRPALLQQSTDQTPLSAVYNTLMELVSAHEAKIAVIVDGLFHSTEALQARMQANSIEMEKLTYEILCEMWPDPDLRGSLRMVAMVSLGAFRVAKEAWRNDGRKEPLAKYLKEAFEGLGKIV